VTAVAGPIPIGASPDGNPVATTFGPEEGFNPTITYHQSGANLVVDVWLNRGSSGVDHLQTLVVPPRGNQNCLILGTTSAPYPTLFTPQRVIGGVVTSDATTLDLTTANSNIVLIGHDAIAPGLHVVLVLLYDDTFRLDAVDDAGSVLHTVSDADRDAFPDTC
jgi:hypothetical protein